MGGNAPELAAWICSHVFTYLLHSTLLLVAAWTLTDGFRIKSPAMIERAWKFAALAGILTAPLQLALRSDSLLTLSWTLPATQASAPGLLSARGRDPQRASASTRGETVEPGRSSARSSSEERARNHKHPSRRPTTRAGGATGSDRSAPRATPATRESPSIAPAVVGGETVGNGGRNWIRITLPVLSVLFVSCGALRLLWQSWFFRRRLAGCRRIRDGVACGLLRELVEERGIRRTVTVFESSRYSEPVAFGFFRRRIILPQGIDTRLDRAALKALIAHELAHLVRGDGLWLWIGRVLCTCFAFQPLNFLARRRWQRAAELQCDAWAVETSVDPLELARCLTAIAEWRLARHTYSLALGAAGSRSSFSDRVERLIDGRGLHDPWGSPRRLAPATAFAASTVLALVFCGPELTVIAGTRVSPAPDVEIPGTSLRESALTALDRELEDLRRELRGLDDDLEGVRLSRAAARVVARLRTRVTALEARRKTMTDLLKGNESLIETTDPSKGRSRSLVAPDSD